MARPPWPILVTIALLLVLPLLQLWPRIRAGFFLGGPNEFEPLNTLLRLWAEYLFLALVVHGLWRRSKFVHIVAIVWQLQVLALGAYTMILNDYGWDYVLNFSPGGFFYGTLPIVVGLVGVVLLLLPTSWRWTSHHRALSRL